MTDDAASESDRVGGMEHELLAMRSRALGVFVLIVSVGIVIANLWSPFRPLSESPLPETFVVDLNTATSAELELLPGVGDKMAADILRYRGEHGGFRAIEELKKVRGIKDGRFRALEPHVKVEEVNLAAELIGHSQEER